MSMSEPVRLSAILVRVKDVCDEKQRIVVKDWQLQDWRHRTCVRCDDKFKRAPEAFVVAFAAIGAVPEVTASAASAGRSPTSRSCGPALPMCRGSRQPQ
jgi:hypothetical protein